MVSGTLVGKKHSRPVATPGSAPVIVRMQQAYVHVLKNSQILIYFLYHPGLSDNRIRNKYILLLNIIVFLFL
jgi:hypothetical protein